MKKIDVTCAIIIKNDKILAVQRGENMNMPLKWEFPGGKIEVNESAIECIEREIKEELNLEIKVIRKLSSSLYQYPEFVINLIPFICHILKGEIKLTEHKKYLFLTREELYNLDWAEADLPIVNAFLEM